MKGAGVEVTRHTARSDTVPGVSAGHLDSWAEFVLQAGLALRNGSLNGQKTLA
jgi:hypothetical protein